MASPANIGFALFDSTGAPLTGQTPTFSHYTDELGTPAAQPPISEVGGGLYTFAPNFNAGLCLAYMIDGGASAVPRYQYGFLRPEDMQTAEELVWNSYRSNHTTPQTFGQWVQIAWAAVQGRIEIDAVAGTLKFFDDDNVTVVMQRSLALADGTTPAGLNALIRKGPGQ